MSFSNTFPRFTLTTEIIILIVEISLMESYNSNQCKWALILKCKIHYTYGASRKNSKCGGCGSGPPSPVRKRDVEGTCAWHVGG